jgi:poly(3-hydroxybutyrate) depolymerase
MRWSLAIGAALLVGCAADTEEGLSGTLRKRAETPREDPEIRTPTGSEPSAPTSLPPGGTLAPGESTISKTIAALPRTVARYVPAAIAQRKLPVVIALHGNGDQASRFVVTSGLRALADNIGFVLVAPQGVPRTISVGGLTTPSVSWDAYNARAANADVQLFDALLDEIVGSGSVDANKVVVYGYSQGGYAAVRYGREASDRLACAAVLAAGDAGGVPTAFARPLRFAIQIGSNDPARANAAAFAQTLQAAGHPVTFHEIAGAGHVPIPPPARTPLDECLAN